LSMFVLFEARGSRPGFGIRLKWSHQKRSRSGFDSGRIAASQRPPIQINFSVGLLNSLIDHFYLRSRDAFSSRRSAPAFKAPVPPDGALLLNLKARLCVDSQIVVNAAKIPLDQGSAR